MASPGPVVADPGDLLASFPVTATDFTLNPVNNELYACAGQEVIVIDTVSLTEVARIPLPHFSLNLATSPDGTRLYVVHGSMASLSVIDVASLQVIGMFPLPYLGSEIAVGGQGRLYVAPGNTGSVHGIMQIDATTGAFELEFSGGISVGAYSHLQVSPDGNTLYLGTDGPDAATVVKFDVSTGAPSVVQEVGPTILGYEAQDLALSPGGDWLYYAVDAAPIIGTGRAVARIRTSDMTVQSFIQTDASPSQVSGSANDRFVYIGQANGYVGVWRTDAQELAAQYLTFISASDLITNRSGTVLFGAFGGVLRSYESHGTLFEDSDGDGIGDDIDNCVDAPNPDQLDTDQDGLGNACDPFPTESNHDLAQCQLDLGESAAQLQLLQNELAACTAALPGDTDSDGEYDPTDACPDTASGAVVDSAGCSRAQFCMRSATDYRSCRELDWKNDEPSERRPEDCSWSFSSNTCIDF